jgi:tetratricopeptide (TPR) repeat protein
MNKRPKPSEATGSGRSRTTGPARNDIEAPNSSDRRDDVLCAIFLVAAVIAVYFPALAGGMLLDDDLHVTAPKLRSLAGLWQIWTDTGVTQQYYPVLHTAFWLEHRLWGDSLPCYHLLNILLHSTASILVVPLMRRLRLAGAWFAALLFALHPVCVESVAWIAEQKNTLSTVLAIAAAIAYLDFNLKRGRTRYCLSTVLFCAALLSKTAVVILPAILLIVVWWRSPKVGFLSNVLPLIPWFLLGGLLSVVTLSVESRLLSSIGADFSLTIGGRLLVAGRAVWFYLGKFAYPAGLTFFYPKWEINASSAGQFIYPAAAFLLLAALFWLARSYRGPLVAALCYGATLLPVLGFFNVEWFVFSYVADHLQYTSILCASIATAAAVAALATRLPRSARFAPLMMGAAVLGALGLMSWRQSARYGDTEAFYRMAVALNPYSAAAHNHLGTVLASKPGRDREAVEEFEAALRISPNAPDGEENLATVLLKDPSRLQEAETHLRAAIRLRPNRKTTHDKLAFVLSGRPDRVADMIAEYHSSLQLDPKDAGIHNALGEALMASPSGFPEAEAEFNAAVQFDPDLAEAHFNLGTLLKRTPGRLNDAMGEFSEALKLRPGFAEAHNGLGLCLAQVPGRLDDAISEFQEALRLKPEFAEAHSNLGLALAFVPMRTEDSLVQLREALRLRPHFAPGWHVIGMVLMQSGRPKEAADAFLRELELSPGNADAEAALERARAELDGH